MHLPENFDPNFVFANAALFSAAALAIAMICFAIVMALLFGLPSN
jgi:hypothetical protein